MEGSPQDAGNTKEGVWTRMSCLLALLAIVLVLVLFFGLQQRVNGLEEWTAVKSRDLHALSEELAAVQVRLEALEERLDTAGETALLTHDEAMSRKAEPLREQEASREFRQNIGQVREMLTDLKGRTALE